MCPNSSVDDKVFSGVDDANRGVRFPLSHCGIEKCGWQFEDDGEDAENDGCEFDNALRTHIEIEHDPIWHQLETELRCEDPKLVSALQFYKYSIYCEAIGEREREGESTVCHSNDRRCEESLSRKCTNRRLSARICFCCARVLVCNSNEKRPDIKMHKAMSKSSSNTNLFLGMNAEQCENTMGLKTYLKEYGKVEGGIDLNDEVHTMSQSIPFNPSPHHHFFFFAWNVTVFMSQLIPFNPPPHNRRIWQNWRIGG